MKNENKKKILLFWSGGKDSALALHYLKKDPAFEVISLITTFDQKSNTVKFHGIPDTLIGDQAKMLNLPLQRIFLPENCSNKEYIEHVGKILTLFKKRGINHVAFGDIHLEEIKKFKIDMLKQLEMIAIFPLWEKKSNDIVKEFFESGYKALVTSVMKDKLDYSFLACEFNQSYVDRLPSGVDCAGENGEFHTFVTFGPNFKMRIPFSKSIAIEEGPYLVSLVKEP